MKDHCLKSWNYGYLVVWNFQIFLKTSTILADDERLIKEAGITENKPFQGELKLKYRRSDVKPFDIVINVLGGWSFELEEKNCQTVI